VARRVLWCAWRREAGAPDLDAEPASHVAERTAPGGRLVRRRRVAPGGGRPDGGRHGEEVPTPTEGTGASAIRQESEVSDAHEAARHDVEEEPPEEFLDREAHDFEAVAVGVVPPAKLDLPVLPGDEPVIGQRDAVRVAAQVGEDLGGAREGPFRVDDPGHGPQRAAETRECRGIGQRRRAAGEGQVSRGGGAVERGEELAAEDEGEGSHGEEKPRRPRPDPARPVGGQPATGDETVEVQMLRQILPPRVQDGGDADRAAEMPRVSPKGEERVGGRSKQQRIDHARIPLSQRVEGVRQGEDDMKVRDREQLGLAGREPGLARGGLTLRAVPIPAAVVRDPDRPAAVTRLLMTAEGRGPTRRDRTQGAVLHGRQPVGTRIRVPGRTDDVRELERQHRAGRARRRGTHRATPVRRGAW
jgi:hypothetical protein